MLKGISPLLSPELLKTLAEMGHGDELVIGDANFAAQSMGKRCIRADGHGVAELFDAILTLFPLDQYVDAPITLMRPDPSVIQGEPPVWKPFREAVETYQPDTKMEQIDRFAFYERAKSAYACVATGERSLYACVILKKGVL